MKSMKFVPISVLLFACVLYGAAQNCAAHNDGTQAGKDLADFSDFKGATLLTVAPSNMPVSFDNASLQADSLRQLFRVQFSIHNKAAAPVDHTKYAIYVLTPDGQTLGGEAFPAGAVLTGTSKTYQVTLHNTIPQNARVILAISQAVFANGFDYSLAPELVLRESQSAGHGLTGVGLEATVQTAVPEFLCTPDWCDDCFNMAQNACKDGIKSFSCDLDCHCSFTCK